MKSPLLSIIILTWNTAKITKTNVDSLIKNIKGIDYEIIVVDNGSTDNTQDVFSKLSNIKYINTGSNLGFAKGNNFGAKQATGDYLLFLNSDMEYISGLEDMFQYYISNKVGLIGPQLLNIDKTPQGSIFPPQTALNAFKQFWLNQSSFSKYYSNNISSVNAISGGAIMIKKSLFKKINGWNEKYFFYYEDMDMCRIIRSLKLEVVYFPNCQLIHHHGASVKKITGSDSGTKRLIASSKLFNGLIIYYLIKLIIWSGQKFFQQK